MANRIAIDQALFSWPRQPLRLLGAQCGACSTYLFPVQETCPKCCSHAVSPRELAARGTLWTWTSQEFPPKSPPYVSTAPGIAFKPFAVGYVELPGEINIESRIVDCDFSELKIGMSLELTAHVFGLNAAGDELVGYAFRPVKS